MIKLYSVQVVNNGLNKSNRLVMARSHYFAIWSAIETGLTLDNPGDKYIVEIVKNLIGKNPDLNKII